MGINTAGCIFCEIVSGESPANIIREWNDAMAIIPLKPVVDGHILVIPKRHANNFAHIPAISATTMFRAAELTQALPGDDFNLITSKGRVATQSVFHLHLHIIPRKKNDKLALPWHSGKHN